MIEMSQQAAEREITLQMQEAYEAIWKAKPGKARKAARHVCAMLVNDATIKQSLQVRAQREATK